MLLIGRAACEICFSQSETIPRSRYWCVISVEFPRSFLRRHFAGKPLVASWSVACFLRLGKCPFPILYSIEVKSKPFYMIKINGFGSAHVKLTVWRGLIQYDLFPFWKFGFAWSPNSRASSSLWRIVLPKIISHPSLFSLSTPPPPLPFTSNVPEINSHTLQGELNRGFGGI